MQESGYRPSCGKFELGEEYALTSVNVFSHRMQFSWIATNVGTIYPKQDELWAIYTKCTLRTGSAAPGGGATEPSFRLVHVLEDVGEATRPRFSVLGRVEGFRTVWRQAYHAGSVHPKYLALFSHRVPACRLQGDEGPGAAGLQGCWDVDPAAIPSSQSG